MRRLIAILVFVSVSSSAFGGDALVVHRMDVNTSSRRSLEKAFSKVEEHSIGCCNWPDRFPYVPECKFRIFHTSDALCIRFDKSEYLTAALETRRGGDVCMDSCVEFFISPDADDAFYNFEFSCIGMANIEHNILGGKCNKATDEIYDMVLVYPSMKRRFFAEKAGANRWSIIVVIPIEAMFLDEFRGWEDLNGAKANLYTCGDRLSLRHYLSWSPVGTPRPQFHSPEYFEQILFE